MTTVPTKFGSVWLEDGLSLGVGSVGTWLTPDEARALAAALVAAADRTDPPKSPPLVERTRRRECPHRPDGDAAACDHCCLFGGGR